MQAVRFAVRKRIGRTQFMFARLMTALANRPSGRRVVFLHIPKTAGSSVNLIFKSYFGSGRSKYVVGIDDREQGPKYREAIARAADAHFVHGHFGFETLEKIRGDAFVFTVLRDPYDRLRSTYGHLTTRTHGNPTGSKFLNMPLAAFLKSDDSEILTWSDNVMARMLVARFDRATVANIAIPMLAERAVSHLSVFDYIACLDNFEHDLTHIAAATGVPCPREMVHQNSTAIRAGVVPLPESVTPFDEKARQLAFPRVTADLSVYAAALGMRGDLRRPYAPAAE